MGCVHSICTPTFRTCLVHVPAVKMRIVRLRTQEAAHLRDELRALTSSETVTHGVHVVTQSAFQRAQSRPERDQYLWAYRCFTLAPSTAYSAWYIAWWRT